MKIKAFQRILLIIESLLLIAVLAAVGLCVCGVFTLSDIQVALDLFADNVVLTVALFVVLFALAVFAVCMMFIGTKKPVAQNVFIQSSEYGNVAITVQSINQLITKHAKGIPGVAEAKVYSKTDPEGLAVMVKIAVLKESIIPTVTQELQASTKQMIADTIGLAAKDVSVLVDNSIAANLPVMKTPRVK